MSGKYNRCPYCNSLRKRYMVIGAGGAGEQKVCVSCYEDFAASSWVKEQKENE